MKSVPKYRYILFIFTVFFIIPALGGIISCQKADGAKKNAEVEQHAPAERKIGTRIGLVAPDFTLPDLTNRNVSLSDYKGYVVMINFWATWCGPCKMEMPALQELENEFSGEKFKLIAVANDDAGLEVVKPYIEEYGYTFTNLIDNQFKVNEMYRVTSIPNTILIDQDGVITNKFPGARDWDSPRYKELIQKLIKSGEKRAG